MRKRMSYKRKEGKDMKSDAVWTALGQLEGGLKLFCYHGINPTLDNAVAVADQSGYYPEQTEDGPLWIDDTRECVINLKDGIVSIPVLKDRDKKHYWCGTGINTVLDLIRWVNGKRNCMLRFTANPDGEVAQILCNALESRVIK
jgi:hypothetical protein